MTDGPDQDFLRQLEIEERKAFALLDDVEREMLAMIGRIRLELESNLDPAKVELATAELDREEAAMRARIAERREETKKHLMELRKG